MGVPHRERNTPTLTDLGTFRWRGYRTTTDQETAVGVRLIPEARKGRSAPLPVLADATIQA
jgi:hypothetical protein